MTGLNNLDLSLFDTPVTSSPVETLLPVTFIVKKTRFGHDIMVCSTFPFPDEIVKIATERNLPLYSGAEIMMLRDCPPDQVDAHVRIKQTFPGAVITEFRKAGN
jgi:hypothetical protein